MKNTKKGFTLVELLVVIAMIAILSTVTVIGLTGCIEEAKLSVDAQEIEQMNTALAAASVAKTPESIVDVVEILAGAGFNTDEGFASLVDGYSIYWYKTYNVILLVKDNGEIESPKENTKMVEDFASNWNSKNDIHNLLYTYGAFLTEKGNLYADFSSALAEGGTVRLVKDLEIVDTLNIDGSVTLDLNGHNLDASVNTSRPFNVQSGAALTIDADGSAVKCGRFGLVNMVADGEGNCNATVVINDGTFTGELDNGAFIKVRGNGANITLNNCDVTITEINKEKASWVLFSDVRDVTLRVIGGEYDTVGGFTVGGDITFDDVKITAEEVGVEAKSGNAKLTDCEIIGKNSKNATDCHDAAVAASGGASVTIENSKVDGTTGIALWVYSTGGNITVIGGSVSGNFRVDYEGSAITIDGKEVAT